MKCLLTILVCMMGVFGYAQKWVVKSNLLYDVTTTMNVAAEVSLSPKWTFDMSANWNPWDFSANKKWKQLSFQPEVRYWFCETFNGHFVGAQHGKLEHRFHFPGYRFRPAAGLPFRRLDAGSRHCLRLSVAALETLERRGGNRHRICIQPLRQVRVSPLWRLVGRKQAA